MRHSLEYFCNLNIVCSGLSQGVHVVYLVMTVFWPVCITVCVTGFILGRIARGRRHELHHLPVVRVGAVASLIALISVIWIRYRWSIARDNSDWPKPWPYPDSMLLAFHNWLDAQLPAGPGLIKLHAEYYSVFGIIHVAGLMVLGIVMLFAGIFAPRQFRGIPSVANAVEGNANLGD